MVTNQSIQSNGQGQHLQMVTNQSIQSKGKGKSLNGDQSEYSK